MALSRHNAAAFDLDVYHPQHTGILRPKIRSRQSVCVSILTRGLTQARAAFVSLASGIVAIERPQAKRGRKKYLFVAVKRNGFARCQEFLHRHLCLAYEVVTGD